MIQHYRLVDNFICCLLAPY